MNLAQLYRGIEEFNKQFFFEAHDTLEDLWHGIRGHDRLFVQGLIQVSVAFYHLFNQNYRGATSQFSKGLEKLRAYLPEHRGIHLETFYREVETWLSKAERLKSGENIDVDERELPKLHFEHIHILNEGE
jgi:predicted metal-dependent hydrolase